MPICPVDHYSVRLDFCDVCGRRVEPPPPGDPRARSGRARASGSLGRRSWIAVVTADRGYFDRVVATGVPGAGMLQFPRYCPERRFRLEGREIRIGRRSASRGIEPEIDLAGPPADPGISHLHALLLAEPGGGWAVLDPGSSNGTMVNGSDIAAGERVALHQGDRVYLGAWTVLAIGADNGPGWRRS